MKQTFDVITMPDGSGVVTMKRDVKIGEYFLSNKIYKAAGGLINEDAVILTINRKDPLDGVPNIRDTKYPSKNQVDEAIETIRKRTPRKTIRYSDVYAELHGKLPAQVEIELDEFGKCDDCKNVGMMNCAHFDRCGATTEYRIKHLHGQPQVKLIYK